MSPSRGRRPAAPAAPTPVEAHRHEDGRANLPTVEGAEVWGTDELTAPRQVTYERNPDLDPQLVWRGKDAQDAADLVVDAPPIYIQEKIDPRVLIEDLRRRPAGDDEPLDLFAGFDGLDELDLVDYYQHEANWSNRMILGDSLQVMASLADREALRGQVQMVYLDPPYGIKFNSNWQASARSRSVSDGKMTDVAREAEQIKAFRDTWQLGIHSYLSYLRDRLVVARDLLTESGSCFVQIGDENVHLVRSLMDEVFGRENFVSQIAFKTTSGKASATLDSVHDHLVWYARSSGSVKYHELRVARSARTMENVYNWVDSPAGGRKLRKSETSALPRFMTSMLHSQSGGATSDFVVHVHGQAFRPPAGAYWKTTASGMGRLLVAGRLLKVGNTLMYKRFVDDHPVVGISGLWEDTVQSTFAIDKYYVVQSANKVIERCMLMCTDPGDLVLDPTCGSGTTAYVAEQWGRRWITIDTSRVALALARQRLMGAKYPYYLLADSAGGRAKEQQELGVSPPQTTPTGDLRQGFVYERVKHITLKSIANNPDIREGMSRAEIDAAIERHAEYETLYDKPYEDRKTVRVTGRFTVESLSPHRALAFAGGPEQPANRETIGEQAAGQDPDGASFEQTILDNLRTAGIQNGRRKERITFAALDAHAGTYLQATGTRATDDADDNPSRVGVAIGPQYGTVSAAFIKAAAREAIAARDVDLLCVLGFAFDAQVTEVTETDGVTVQASAEGFAEVTGERRLGRIKVLMVRMNVDLLMGEELRKSGVGNLFTVFGEPDIDLTRDAEGRVVVELRGVDVYNPTTGEIRSGGTDQIALWMIDTDYNEESFFVRHCYFTGGGDPYKRLKTALRADIDSDAWDSLNSTTSRAFDVPPTGKIAVKVINDYGDEVMKVFEVPAS